MGEGEGWGEGNGNKEKGQKGKNRANGEWKGTLCGSCDFGPKCLLGCCCPGFGNLFVAEKIGSDDCAKWIGFLDFLGGGLIFSAFGAWTLRKKIRERDGIDGDDCEDCCVSFCCFECVQCQHANHVEVDN